MSPRLVPWLRTLLALATGLACAGCLRNHVVVEMIPGTVGLERRITIGGIPGADSMRGRVAPRLEPPEIAMLARAYGSEPDSSRPYEVRRVFADIPEDVGNRGWLHQRTTMLGTAWSYTERFRGDTRPGMRAANLLALADSIADIVLGWADREVGDHPGWPGLHAFLDGDLRGQLRDLVVGVWLDGVATSSEPQGWLPLQWEEHPGLLALLADTRSWDDIVSLGYTTERAMDRLRGDFARALGLREDGRDSHVLAFLADERRMHRSLARYLSESRGLSDDEAMKRWSASMTALLGLGANADEDSIRVVLKLPVDPTDSNGEWDPARRQVVWRALLPAPSAQSWKRPLVCLAQWSVPDEARQRRHFGRVVLEKEALLAYCDATSRLTPARRREWERALGRVRPHDLRPLARFVFADERARGMLAGDSTSAAEPLRAIVLQATRGHD